jgi:hypothetical protein
MNSRRSGIVIAGFGEEDLFPQVIAYEIEGVADSLLKYKLDTTRSDSISFGGNQSIIIPFAQDEMVHTFMSGIDPGLQDAIFRDIAIFFEKLPEILMDTVPQIDNAAKELWKKDIYEKLKEKITGEYFDKMGIFIRDRFINPVVSVVETLPKSELASMAESLINLTSLKRRVSNTAETVGGPIDVAVISKGDGFIWIKRKHYFSPEYNARFMSKYIERGGSHGDQTENR